MFRKDVVEYSDSKVVFCVKIYLRKGLDRKSKCHEACRSRLL